MPRVRHHPEAATARLPSGTLARIERLMPGVRRSDALRTIVLSWCEKREADRRAETAMARLPSGTLARIERLMPGVRRSDALRTIVLSWCEKREADRRAETMRKQPET